MLYGVNPVLEALEASRASVVYIYSGRRAQAREIVERAGESGVDVKVMHDAGFFDSRFPKGHQGVAATLRESATYSVEDIMAIPLQRGEPALFLILDGIEDPRNLGAVLRSAEAAGVHGVVMEKRRSAPIGPEAIKASAGAALHMPISVVSNIKLAMRAMKEEGIMVIGAEAGGEVRHWGADMSGPVALVAGSEGRGLRRTVAENCDLVVSLPILGKVNSLNTSVAAGILVYEALRQRGI
jgi:23S rRNA (guanosine2251-2'-O)-methyltransferase